MNSHWMSAGFALCVALTPLANSQTPPRSVAGAAVQRSAAGIDCISGGAGDEERAAMTAQRDGFPFEVVLSTNGGEYLVAGTLSVRTSAGELLRVPNAGPFVMMNLAPGQYTLEATWNGKTERRALRVTSGRQTVQWRFPA